MPTILATEAKRTFGSVLERVSHGEAYTVVRRGKPVARIVPIEYRTPESQFGALAAYADPERREREADAFARAMEAKHGAR